MVDKVEDININKLKMKGNVGKRDDLNLGKTTSSQEPSSMEKSVDERVKKSKQPLGKTPGMYMYNHFTDVHTPNPPKFKSFETSAQV